MTWVIEKDESTASRRVIEFRTFTSNGTGPDTGSSNSSLRMSIGGNAQFTPNALVSAISSAAGMYYFILNQSDVSQLGNHALWYEGAFAQHVANVQVVNYNPFSSFSNIAAKAYSGVSFEVTTGGIQPVSVGKDAYSGVSVEITTGGIQTASVGKGNYSGVSSEILSGGIQTSSIGAGNYSGMSVEVKSGGIQTGSVGAGQYSNMTVRVTGIVAGSFNASAIDAAALATDAGQEIADRMLLRGLATGADTGRTVQEAFRTIRNRTAISGSTGTVYQEDDATSSYTFSVTTAAAISFTDLDPAG